MFKRALALALGALALSPAVSGLGGEKCVIFPHEHLLQPLSLLSKATSLAQTILGRSSTSTPRPFLIVSKYHGATPLVLDSEDDEAIHVARISSRRTSNESRGRNRRFTMVPSRGGRNGLLWWEVRVVDWSGRNIRVGRVRWRDGGRFGI